MNEQKLIDESRIRKCLYKLRVWNGIGGPIMEYYACAYERCMRDLGIIEEKDPLSSNSDGPVQIGQ